MSIKCNFLRLFKTHKTCFTTRASFAHYLRLSSKRTTWKTESSNFNQFHNNNKPFPSSLVPLFQNEAKCITFHMKMSSACSFIFMQIKVIFIRMVSHLDSLWNRSTRELGNGLLLYGSVSQRLRTTTFMNLIGWNRYWLGSRFPIWSGTPSIKGELKAITQFLKSRLTKTHNTS